MDFGGISGGGFNTPFNTIGIGDPVPADTNTAGSGDLFGSKTKSQKKEKPNVKKGAIDYGQQLPLIVMSNK